VQTETAIYAGIALAGIALLVWIIPAYTPPYPGYGAPPALVPNVAVGLMLFMAVLELVRTGISQRRGRRSPADAPPSATPAGSDAEASDGFTQAGQANLGHLLRFMVPCGLLVPAWTWIGFIPASILFLLVVQYLVGQRRPVTAVLLALVVVAVIYAAMRYGFSVPVPGGAFPEYLPTWK
jgi:hypothetical protein